MAEDTSLLNHIFQNAQMGLTSIPHIINCTNDPIFKHALNSQKEEYQLISDTAQMLMEQTKESPEEISSLAKISSYMMTEFKTMTDRSTSHLAEMMIQGSIMGIIAITRNLNSCPDAPADVKELAQKLLDTEDSNIKDMRKFL